MNWDGNKSLSKVKKVCAFLFTGYAVEDERIGFNVTSYPPSTNVHEFKDCLKQSLDDIYDVFNGNTPRSS